MEKPEVLYLSMDDVEMAAVSMAKIISALEKVYRLKGQDQVEMPPKIGIHTRPNALIHAMPAYISASKSAGMKWVSAYPENYKFNAPQIAGLIVLNNVQTGLPYCIMDCRWITAKRTGAKTALAATFFARPDARSVGILGCGVQGRSNLEALSHRFNIAIVNAYDINTSSAEKYATEMEDKLQLNVNVVDSPQKAVQEMDIVVTAGPIIKEPSPVIEDDWFKPGAFAAPVDFDSYWKPDLLKNADLFATDDVKQMFYYQSIGYFKNIPPREKVLDLGDVAAKKASARTNDKQRIIAMNLGLALDDMATAPLVYKTAKEKSIGIWLDL